AGVTLRRGREVVVAAVNVLAAAVTTNPPQLQMPPPGFGALGGIADAGNLALAGEGGHYLQVFASIVPSLLSGSPALPGSNVISGGSRSVTIFGDYGAIGTLPSTRITAIDNQLQRPSVTMLRPV